MGETFHGVKESVKFSIEDMLWGKCLFPGIDKIDSCWEELKQTLAKDDRVKVVEVRNRLEG